MRLVVIESPYAGDVAANVAFCEAVCRYAALQGYAPMASHLLYTRFLDDTVPEERRVGIDAGLAWAAHAEAVWFCLRPGEDYSRGMQYAAARYVMEGRSSLMQIRRFTQDGIPLEIDGAPVPVGAA